MKNVYQVSVSILIHFFKENFVYLFIKKTNKDYDTRRKRTVQTKRSNGL